MPRQPKQLYIPSSPLAHPQAPMSLQVAVTQARMELEAFIERNAGMTANYIATLNALVAELPEAPVLALVEGEPTSDPTAPRYRFAGFGVGPVSSSIWYTFWTAEAHQAAGRPEPMMVVSGDRGNALWEALGERIQAGLIARYGADSAPVWPPAEA